MAVSARLEQSLDSLIKKGIDSHLGNLQRGLEKESLRVSPQGTLSQTDHPKTLGSTLTHPLITTDYSESLLEFVTPVHNSIDNLLKELHDIHHFTYQHIGDEKLWVNSMPCIVESEETIPIAKYGSSNVAKMKEAYRRGLSHRYGSLMQTIAGIHFNFSMPEQFWSDYLNKSEAIEIQAIKSAQYFSAIRNFHRHSWLGIYLFGASPAVCKTFLRNREHHLDVIDAHSFYSKNATSLRLSGLGYSNDAQANIEICYNSVDSFVKSLRQAIQTSNPDYEKYGLKIGDEYQQLNPNLLQIENEFYSSIRPKRIAASGESPCKALQQQGVQYIEVRSIDLNPFVPIGIDQECIRFFDTFLLYCMFSNDADLAPGELMQSRKNQTNMVMNGRDANATIIRPCGEVNAREEMSRILGEMQPVAEILDQSNNTDKYITSLNAQFEKVKDSEATPSAQILNIMKSEDMSFYEFSMMMSLKTANAFKQTELDPEINKKFEQLAIESHEKRQEVEDNDTLSFDDFLVDYFLRQNEP